MIKEGAKIMIRTYGLGKDGVSRSSLNQVYKQEIVLKNGASGM